MRMAGLGLCLFVIGGSTACGGQDTVSAREYLTATCTAFGDWAEKLTDGFGEVQSAAGGSPEDQKESFINFLSDMIDETETLIGRVEEAGVPDVESGEEIADQFPSALEDMKASLEDARSQLEDVSTENQQVLQQETQAVFASMQESFGEVGQGLEDLESGELESAAEDVEACQGPPGGSGP